MNENKIILPIEIRSPETSKGKYSIRGKARLIPGKKYTYMFKTDSEGRPIESLKEIFSEKSWDKMKSKILSKKVFVDEMHKTVASKNVRKFLNDLERETGKDLKELKSNIDRWMKVSDMPLFKLEDAILEDDSIALDMSMNPYFRDVDEDHAKYFDAIWNSLNAGFINSMSLNFNPTEVERRYDQKGKEHIPIIHDMDVYGVSLLDTPAHEEMRDVLDVAIRSTQTERERTGGNKMSEDEKTKIEAEVRKKLEEESLKAENEKLKKESEAKDALLKEQADKGKEEEKNAELKRLKDENERLEKDNLAKDKQINEKRIPSSGLVPQPPQTSSNAQEKIKEALETLKDDPLALGKLIHLQSEFNGLKNLPSETRKHLQQLGTDLIAPRNK
jgi:hypothetical protein